MANALVAVQELADALDKCQFLVDRNRMNRGLHSASCVCVCVGLETPTGWDEGGLVFPVGAGCSAARTRSPGSVTS